MVLWPHESVANAYSSLKYDSTVADSVDFSPKFATSSFSQDTGMTSHRECNVAKAAALCKACSFPCCLGHMIVTRWSVNKIYYPGFS